MELQQVLAALRASWAVVLCCILLGLGVGLGVSAVQEPRYTSSTQLFVATTDTANSQAAFQGSQLSEQRVSSYARLIEGRDLAAAVARRLSVDLEDSGLEGNVQASVVPETVLIEVRVTSQSPEDAQAAAEATGDVFTELVEELETPPSGDRAPIRVAVTEGATLPKAPSSPRWLRNATLGVVAGLLLGVATAVGRAYLDRTVKDSEEISREVGAPVIGAILRDTTVEKRHVANANAATNVLEGYRQLRNNLQFLDVDNPPKVIMMSSALPSEGKTTAVVNLALALVDADRKVTIVEADLRKPKVTRYLGMVGGVGLTNLLAGTADLEDVIQRYGEDGLQVIAAGPTPPNPGELLASSHMAELLEKLRAANDFVLIDAPPLLPVADSSGLAVHTDGVLLSVRYGSTRRDQLQQAAATLDRVGARTLGVILNIVPPKAEVAAAYGYGYGYGYESGGKHGS